MQSPNVRFNPNTIMGGLQDWSVLLTVVSIPIATWPLSQTALPKGTEPATSMAVVRIAVNLVIFTLIFDVWGATPTQVALSIVLKSLCAKIVFIREISLFLPALIVICGVKVL